MAVENPETDFTSFYETSGWLGRCWFLNQATGGNTSVKTKEGLLIKASGARLSLADEAPERTFVNCDCPASGMKPSMEVAFHKVIPWTYVFHYHSIRSLLCSVLGLSPELKKQLHYSGLDCVIIPYIEPGHELANKIEALQQCSEGPDIFLLENHGVIVGANTLPVIRSNIQLLDRISAKILDESVSSFALLEQLFEQCEGNEFANEFLQLNSVLGAALSGWEYRVSPSEYLFPDQAVYLGPLSNVVSSDISADRIPFFHADSKRSRLLLRSGITEIQRDYAFVVLYLLLGASLCPSECIRTISNTAGEAILSNPSEVYRRSLP